MPNEQLSFVWQGQTFEIEARDTGLLRRELAIQIRRQVWNHPHQRFTSWQDRWQWYANSSGTMRWIVEAAGRADLPPQSEMASLSRRARQLNSQLAPNTVLRFMNNFPAWNRKSTVFCNKMVNYSKRFERGGQRTVRVLEITRGRSFDALKVLALISSGGTSGAAGAAISAAARQTAGRVLAREAATSFLVRGISDTAGNLGTVLSGGQVTGRMVAQQFIANGLASVADAALGSIVGRYLGALTGRLKNTAATMISRGQLVRGVTLEVTAGQLEAPIMDTIQHMITNSPRDIRQMLEVSLRGNRESEAASRSADFLIGNRTFQRELERRLQA